MALEIIDFEFCCSILGRKGREEKLEIFTVSRTLVYGYVGKKSLKSIQSKMSYKHFYLRNANGTMVAQFTHICI